MAIKNPLVIVSGVFSQLPTGDTVPGTDTIAQASGNAALSVGATALASGNAALVVGSTATASGNAALVVGATAQSSGNAALAVAVPAQASGNAALSVAVSASNLAVTSSALAQAALASGNAALSGAFVAQASGDAGIAIGLPALASGNAALVDAGSAVVVANTALASGNAAVVDAAAAVVTANTALASGNTALFEVVSAQASGNAALVYGVNALPYSGGTIRGDVANTSSGYLGFPVGTTAQRPAAPASGVVRYNATLGEFEGYKTAWSTVVTKDSLGDITVNSINTGALAGFKNAIINGNFNHWQRGTSQTSVGYNSADRWLLGLVGSSCTLSQQSFTVGQTDVPGNPTYFCRLAVTSSAGTGNYVFVSQKIESVYTFQGQTITISFWSKANASKPISIEVVQNFGTGGSPSTAVASIGVTKTTLSTSWQKVTTTVSVPSISGKTLGSDANDFIQLRIWFDAGTDFNTNTSSLGQQSGTFDIANVQVEPGSQATTFEVRPPAVELALCQRYYWRGRPSAAFNFAAYAGSSVASFMTPFRVTMRATPTVNASLGSATLVNCTVGSYAGATANGARLTLISTTTTTNANIQPSSADYFEASAEL